MCTCITYKCILLLNMDLNQYQDKSRSTALYPNAGNNLIYPTLGLSGESGEVADKVKKVLRDKNGVFEKEDKDQIMMELGDVLWYVAQLSTELGFDLNDVAKANLNKLFSRLERGKISGSGDRR